PGAESVRYSCLRKRPIPPNRATQPLAKRKEPRRCRLESLPLQASRPVRGTARTRAQGLPQKAPNLPIRRGRSSLVWRSSFPWILSDVNRPSVQLCGAEGVVGKLLSFPGRPAVAAQGTVVPAEQPIPAPGPRSDPGVGRLTVSNVVKSFKKRTVVRGVSLELNRGEAVGLLGPNGAGKTTVFYMITGLIP